MNGLRSFLVQLSDRNDVVIAVQILVEVYLLIRNPAVFPNPYSSKEAAQVCEGYRSNPRWSLVECMPVMGEVGRHAAEPVFARRRIIYARLALTLRAAGVTDLAPKEDAATALAHARFVHAEVFKVMNE